MKLYAPSVAVLLAGGMLFAPPRPAVAELTLEQRRELNDIRDEVGKAASLVRRKNVDEAEQILGEAEKRLGEIVKAAALEADDRAIMPVRVLIERQRELIARQKGTATDAGKGTGVSYVQHIAPILEKRCGNCHGNNPRAGLQLTTFAGLKKGGQNGPPVAAGKAPQSLIIRRLIAPANLRMPKNGGPLPAGEIQAIALWINQGAKFDGKDENAPGGGGLADDPSNPTEEKPKVEIAMATGNETVSFTKDIAPFMVNLCVRCHSGANPRSGFSLETFEKLMQGGDSGQVVIPGDLDASRLWDLAGKQDPIKMPPGNALMTRTNWRNLRTWIEEGSKFDGGDATKPLRELVPTEAELRAMELAKLTPAEFAQRRLERTKEMWQRVLPKEEPRYVETDEFLVLGNASQERLKQIGEWAELHAKDLRTLFRDKSERLWRGKLAVIVFKERFGYDEFNLIIHRREAPREMLGHSVVEPDDIDAYIALEDVGDVPTAQRPTMRVNLIEHLTAAYLKKQASGELPDWLLRGAGLAMAVQTLGNDDNLLALTNVAREALGTLTKAEDLFASGTFSPTTVGAVGYSVVAFLRKAGGDAKFGQFVGRLQEGTSVAEAAKAIYGTDLRRLANAFFASLPAKRTR